MIWSFTRYDSLLKLVAEGRKVNEMKTWKSKAKATVRVMKKENMNYGQIKRSGEIAKDDVNKHWLC